MTRNARGTFVPFADFRAFRDAELLARIAATDRLIDLIVYRLYGLTEEEVAVVEGVGPRNARNSANDTKRTGHFRAFRGLSCLS